MQEWIAAHIDLYGPIAVWVLLMMSGVGIPLGEDIIVIPAGILVGRGDLSFWPTLLAAYLGVSMADVLWFLIIRRFGAPLLHRKWLKRIVHPRRLLEAKHQMDRRGAWVIVMARFIPGSRTSAITVAGLLHLPLWKMAAATFSCVAITAPLQLGFGWLIGRELSSHGDADTAKYAIGAIVLAVAFVVGVIWFRRTRRAAMAFGRPQRARARWLRKRSQRATR